MIHRMMSILRDGTLALLTTLQDAGLLDLNNDATYVGSGGLGWSDELPQPDYAGDVRLRDLWGFAESQETVACRLACSKSSSSPINCQYSSASA